MQTYDLIGISIALVSGTVLVTYFVYVYDLKRQSKNVRKVQRKIYAWPILIITPWFLAGTIWVVLGPDTSWPGLFGLFNVFGAALLAVGGIVATLIRHHVSSRIDSATNETAESWQDVVLATVSIGGVFLLLKAVYDLCTLANN